MHPRAAQPRPIVNDCLHSSKVDSPRDGDAMRDELRIGDRVVVANGAHAGRTGIIENFKGEKLLVRLAPSASSTSQPSVVLQPGKVRRA